MNEREEEEEEASAAAAVYFNVTFALNLKNCLIEWLFNRRYAMLAIPFIQITSIALALSCDGWEESSSRDTAFI
jgi:hypothetical protein